VLNTLLYFPSGAVYPPQGFPGWMQVIAAVDPFTYAVHAFKSLLLKNTGFADIGGDLAYLLIFSASLLKQNGRLRRKVQALGGGVWGHNVPLSNKDFTWYFLYHGIHNRGVDIISKDQSRVTFNTAPVIAATQSAVDLILKQKVQPPVGQYDREAGVALFKGGRVAFLHDEPLRLAVFRKEGLPFKWDFVNPVGAPGGKRTIFSTTGHWVMASKAKNQEAAWELVKFLSSPAFANEFGAHYGWAPVRSDVNTSKGDAQVTRVNGYVLKGWDGLPTGPKMAQLTSVYGQAIEAAATGNKSVRAAMAKAQADGTRILKS
jgi:ABC-type glycerol-3-phosphate transport system substrate-binding protein